MSANTVLVMFGAESCVCVDCNQVYKEGRVMKAVMSILVDNCIDFDGMERSILAKEICWDVGLVGFDSIDQEEKRPKLQRHLAGLPRGIMAPEVYKKVGGRWEAVVFTDMVSDGPMSHGKVFCILARTIFNRWRSIPESKSSGKEGCRGPSLDKVLENRKHWMSIVVDSDPLRMLTMNSVSPSSRVLREEEFVVESDLVDFPFEERRDS
ncbi:hypothetical protein Tco_0452618 [Tanacetum coccineum]